MEAYEACMAAARAEVVTDALKPNAFSAEFRMVEDPILGTCRMTYRCWVNGYGFSGEVPARASLMGSPEGAHESRKELAMRTVDRMVRDIVEHIVVRPLAGEILQPKGCAI